MKLGLIAKNPRDGTSFYRAVGPLVALQKAHPELQVIRLPAQVDWTHLAEIDVLLMQRPAGMDDFKIVVYAKDMGIPIWLDFDDNLLQVPLDNPNFKTYGQEDVLKSIHYMCHRADAITVTTQALKDALPGKTAIIPNAFDDHLFKFLPQKNGFRKSILWRGSRTHDKDLFYVRDAILDIYNSVHFKNENWEFIFMGSIPWFLADKMPGIVYYDSTDMVTYMTNLKALKPSILIHPLYNNEFNRAKSNICWIEATYAGATCVTADFQEIPKNCFVSTDSENFTEKVLDLMKNRGVFYEESFNFIDEHLMLSKVNEMRWELLNKICR